MRSDISATMAACLALAHEHAGQLVRYMGGYWSFRDAPRDHNGQPIEAFGDRTVTGLVIRKRMEFTEWQDGRRGKFPIAAELVQE